MLLISGSMDCVVTVPETLAPVCVSVQVTIVVAIGVLLFTFVSFESTPVPIHVTCGGAVDPLDGEADDPSPPPHEITNAARAVAMMIGRAGFMRTFCRTTKDYRSVGQTTVMALARKPWSVPGFR